MTLIKRAYTKEQFRQMAAESAFGTCAMREEGIGFEISLMKG